jgi:Putative peptidoglycan binding domain/IPT/TIG domain
MTSGSPPTTTPTSGQAATVKPPTIKSFSPMSGAAGTIVVITGEHFTGARSVGFSHVSASFTVSSCTEMEATVPNGAQTGKISVDTPAGTATSSMNFGATATIGLRLAEYKRLVNQTNLLGAGLLGGVALFNALHALKPIPEAILATLFVIIVCLVAWVRGSVDYQKDLIEARKEEKQLNDSMTMQEAANADHRIQQDVLLSSRLYRGAAILVLVGAVSLFGLEWVSVLFLAPDLTKSLKSIASELHETRNDLAKIAAAPTPPDLTKSLESIASELHETRNDLAKIAVAPTPPDLTKSLESIASELHETRNDLHDIFDPRPAPPNRPTLSWGSKGPQVEKLQKKLGVAPDGEFGSATKNVVITFQRDHNLQQDGIVGPRTWAALPP